MDEIKKEQTECKSECSAKELQYLRDIAEKEIVNLSIDATVNSLSEKLNNALSAICDSPLKGQ